jgi:hypothetical protein
MRKIKILMAIFLSLFVMVILQSCEKETFDVTEQESQNDVVETNKPLEKEGSWFSNPKNGYGKMIKKLDQRYVFKNFPGGKMVYDRYSNFAYVDLKKDYNITDVYIVNTDKEYADVKMTSEDYVVMPINLNVGYDNSNPWMPRKANNIFLVLKVRAYNENADIVVNFNILSYSRQQIPSVGYKWNNCTNIKVHYFKGQYMGMGINGYFNKELGNLNHGTDGRYVYLQTRKTFLRQYNQSIAIKGVAIAYSEYEGEARDRLEMNGYYTPWTDLNYGNSSRQKVYLGWRN